MSRWRWPEEDQESVDISELLNDVVSRPGWRAGGYVMLELAQHETQCCAEHFWNNRQACGILSVESSLDNAPALTLDLDPVTTQELAKQEYSKRTESQACEVSVSGFFAGQAKECQERLLVPKTAITASSTMKAGRGNVFKDVYPQRQNINWYEGLAICESMGANMCTNLEMAGAAKNTPFWGPVTESDVYVPYLKPGQGNLMFHEQYMKVSSSGYGQERRPNWMERIASFVACCGPVGHPAYMAADSNEVSFWKSDPIAEDATLQLYLGEGLFTVGKVSIKWTEHFPLTYSIEGSKDGISWTIMGKKSGRGGTDIFPISSGEPLRYVRLAMSKPTSPGNGFGVNEFQVYGCQKEEYLEFKNFAEDTDGDALLTASLSVTPIVHAVIPSRGTTAGGSDVTITGHFFGMQQSGIGIKFGPYNCEITSVISLDGNDTVTCKTGASGAENGGVKDVIVSVKGYGDSVKGKFWYIDTWSARTTWGGANPPLGCGPFKDDRSCVDSVVIPKGQTILLDVSPPRFYLLLIEGSLIFERKDLHLQAGYILIRGGHLEIGTEQDPFLQRAEITLYGHPQSIELPTFGSKVLACYKCTMDIHGAPTVSWTLLSKTVNEGDNKIVVRDTVNWPIGSAIAIATTDYESFMSSHTEVAIVTGIEGEGRTVVLTNFSSCSTWDKLTAVSRQSSCLRNQAGFRFTHISEDFKVQGRKIPFRAEVGLMNRNIIIRGDHDELLCPDAELGLDGKTKLSCNEFGGQGLFFHSPGHESLRARISNMEIANAGQAFRLGKYAVHWHMIGNVRQSFQKNSTVHHSWNRGTAIHGTHFLEYSHNFLFTVKGHTVFIEDGVETNNVVEGNLALITIPSQALLATDTTPAGFWIVSGANYVVNNHAVGSRRYGIWFRPERSTTGTSTGTPMETHPIEIPILKFSGNTGHSNLKYGQNFDPVTAHCNFNCLVFPHSKFSHHHL